MTPFRLVTIVRDCSFRVPTGITIGHIRRGRGYCDGVVGRAFPIAYGTVAGHYRHNWPLVNPKLALVAM
jgi:hypothetical protein